MENLIFGALALVVVLVVLSRVKIFADFLQDTVCEILDVITYIVFTPFRWAAEQLLKADSWVEKKLFKKNRYPALTPFGGLPQVLRMGFCVLFSVGVVMGMLLFGGVRAVDMETDILLSFPVFAILNMLAESGFSYEAVFQASLFSVLSVGFMKRNTGKHWAVQVLYDLIFTVFCACLLYVIPDAVYGLPLQATPFLRWLLRVFLEVPVLNILMILLGFALMLAAIYVILSTYLLALRELVFSFAYSLWPFAILLFAVTLISGMGWNKTITSILYYLLTLGLTVVIGMVRIKGEEN